MRLKLLFALKSEESEYPPFSFFFFFLFFFSVSFFLLPFITSVSSIFYVVFLFSCRLERRTGCASR